MSSPWARLITPISPKTIAKPRAAINKTAPILTPLKIPSMSPWIIGFIDKSHGIYPVSEVITGLRVLQDLVWNFWLCSMDN
jgi:hypothetical protein